MARILLVDDDPSSQDSTRRILEFDGHVVTSASDGAEALEKLREGIVDLIVTDIRMPKMDGFEFFRALTASSKRIPVVFMTAFGQIEEAVWAMKEGAVDFLSKPFKRQALRKAVEAALQRTRSGVHPGGEVSSESIAKIRGSGIAARDMRAMIERVSGTDATVLIQGESGSGKELVARALHAGSNRQVKPIIVLNCAAIPENLMEAELFGWERGAFTGAIQTKPGLFEAANGGTLFLDEIGDLPLSLQAKLLRVIQEREVRRLGGTRSHPIDVRLVAATHRDLRALVASGAFREDLFFRIGVVEMHVPSLRERAEDIPELLAHALAEACTRHGKEIRGFSNEAAGVLASHRYPGNIRELQNIVERAVIFSTGPEIAIDDLPPHLIELAGFKRVTPTVSFEIGTPLKDVESELIRRSLEAARGDKTLAAKLLGVTPRTIYRWLERQEAGGSTDESPVISPILSEDPKL